MPIEWQRLPHSLGVILAGLHLTLKPGGGADPNGRPHLQRRSHTAQDPQPKLTRNSNPDTYGELTRAICTGGGPYPGMPCRKRRVLSAQSLKHPRSLAARISPESFCGSPSSEQCAGSSTLRGVDGAEASAGAVASSTRYILVMFQSLETIYMSSCGVPASVGITSGVSRS
jgi:hypothetical protein